MKIITKKISELTPCPYNPRSISDEALTGLTASIKEYGYIDPIIWNKRTGNVVGGNMRMKVLKEQGVAEADVVVVDLSLEQEKPLNVALNSKYIAGDWTDELADLLKEIENNTPELFADLNLADLENEIPFIIPEIVEGLTEPDDIPDLKEDPVIQTGDLIVLGAHKILCGDATNLDDVKKLMQAEKLDQIWVDPPYNIGYVGKTKEQLKIKNDSMSVSDFCTFLEAAFRNYRTFVKNEASFYIFHPSSYAREFQDSIEKTGFEIRSRLIWAKHVFTLSFSRYKQQFEPFYYGHVSGQSDNWYGDKCQSTVWNFDKPLANRLHPTMKPVELIEHALINSSKPEDFVGDFFLGSGSSLIACERLGRQCRGIELDPVYAQVSLQRWLDYTGKHDDIKIIRDGKTLTWSELKNE